MSNVEKIDEGYFMLFKFKFQYLKKTKNNNNHLKYNP